MDRRSRIRLCAVFCLLLACPASAQEILTERPRPAPPAAAADTARAPAADRTWAPVHVTTEDGWTMADVSVGWLADGSRVRVIRADGAWKDHQPWTITAVHAADGTDLTAEIAAARPGGTAAASRSPKSAPYNEVGVPMPVRASLGVDRPATRPFVVAVTAGGGYATYLGDWFEGFEDSPSLQAAVRFGTSRRNWFTFSYRRQGGGHRSATGYDYDLNPVRVDLDLRIDEYLVMVGVPTAPLGSTRHVPYAEFGVAVMHHVASLEVNGFEFLADSETKLGMVIQFGGLIALGRNTVLDLGLDIAHKPGIFSDDEAGGTIFGGHVGFGWVDW